MRFLVTECGYARSQIHFAVAVAPAAIFSHPSAFRRPDFAWAKVANATYHFPWGERF